MLGKGGGATSRADGQAIDGTGTSDSYEVTGLPGWLPHRTDRQVLDQDTAPKVEPGRASRGSDRCWWGPGIINGHHGDVATVKTAGLLRKGAAQRMVRKRLATKSVAMPAGGGSQQGR